MYIQVGPVTPICEHGSFCFFPKKSEKAIKPIKKETSLSISIKIPNFGDLR